MKENSTKSAAHFIATVNLFFPCTNVLVQIVDFGFQPKTFVDSDGNTWYSSELSNIKHN